MKLLRARHASRFILIVASSLLLGQHSVFAATLPQLSQHRSDASMRRLPCPGEQASQWVPGVDFNVLLPVTEPTAEVVEIMEISMYTTSIAPDEFRDELKEWIDGQQGKVIYRRFPAMAGLPHSRLQARMFFTLEILERQDLHEPLAHWIRNSERWKIYHNVWRPSADKIRKLNIEFIKENDIAEHEFLDVYDSHDVSDRVKTLEMYTSVLGVQGTPTFVVNRKYSVSIQRIAFSRKPTTADYMRMLDLIEFLASDEARQECPMEK